MLAIRFRRPCPPYNAGEVAGFDAKTAERFIRRGTAELVRAPAPAEPEKALTGPPADKMVKGSKTKA